MIDENVAGASVSMATEVFTKSTDVFFELLKLRIQHSARGDKKKGKKVLYGGKVTYQKLRAGGEVTMIPSFAKEDYKKLLSRARKMEIPLAAIVENGKEKTVSVFFNVKDKDAINAIIKDIVNEKLSGPQMSERMITIENEHADAFRLACKERDIPVYFLNSEEGIKCVFGSDSEKEIKKVLMDFEKTLSELEKTDLRLERTGKRCRKIIFDDNEKGKRLKINFCTKARVERILREQFGYSAIKAAAAAALVESKLTNDERRYYLSSTRTLEATEHFRKNILFENESSLLKPYIFSKLKLKGENEEILSVTNDSGDFAVLYGGSLKRQEAEEIIRRNLKINDKDTLKEILNKAEKLGVIEVPERFKEEGVEIEKETKNTFRVKKGETELKLSLDNMEESRRILAERFGITEARADRIIEKARHQSLSDNLIKKEAKSNKGAEFAIKHKKRERGAR